MPPILLAARSQHYKLPTLQLCFTTAHFFVSMVFCSPHLPVSFNFVCGPRFTVHKVAFGWATFRNNCAGGALYCLFGETGTFQRRFAWAFRSPGFGMSFSRKLRLSWCPVDCRATAPGAACKPRTTLPGPPGQPIPQESPTTEPGTIRRNTLIEPGPFGPSLMDEATGRPDDAPGDGSSARRNFWRAFTPGPRCSSRQRSLT